MSGESGRRMPQLDALRAFAALAVIYSHATSYPGHALGAYGVTLFFVLSGFLITGILLGARKLRESGESLGLILRQFYARRSLRIFPLYYFVLFVLVAVGYGPARQGLGWLATYLGDFYLPHRPESAVSHFWSLAVEEQFYLLWPWAILLLPRAWLPRLAGTLIVVAPLYRVWGWAHGVPQGVLWTSPIASAEALAIGGLLAMAGPTREVRRFLLITGFAALALGMICRVRLPDGPQPLWSMGPALLSAWLVARAALGVGGMPGRVLSFPPLLWIGTISYGVYVYHLPLLMCWQRIGPHAPGWLTFLVISGATIGVAAASWYLFERPISALKRYFPYAVSPRATGGSPCLPSASVAVAPTP